MVRPENTRVIATLNPKAQAALLIIKEQLGLKDSQAITLSLIYYAELMKRGKM